jgi:hypothetical protein
MNDAQLALESSLSEIDKLRTAIKKSPSAQVRSADERSIVKATALSWFNTHRPKIITYIVNNQLAKIDEIYKEILALSEKNTSRKKYELILKSLREQLVEVRSQNILVISNTAKNQNSSDEVPDFSVLISDTKMQEILSQRWRECTICIFSNSPLAGTVMMGGLLEALLLARINQLPDMTKVFQAKSVPKDKIGKPLPLKEWGLKNYIDVAHELGWISQTEKDLGSVLRDYRNYIHPYKERSHGIKLENKDAKILWDVSKSISRQLLNSLKLP